MNSDQRNRFLSALIFFVLIASAVFTVPARADSGSPPPAPEPTGASSESTATTPHVTQVPTTVTNVGGGDNGGHEVKLESQKAAYVAEAGDPVWCPSTMGAPTPGAGACTTNYGDMAGLLSYLNGHQKTVDGTIWINGTGVGLPDSSGPFNLDGSAAFTTMSFHKLTFKGGWTGIGGTINTSNPSLFSKSLNISDWGKDITLSDVQFNNVTTGSGEGLSITTSGNITLTRTQANNDNGWGALLNTGIGTGIVTVTNSQFNHDNLTTDLYALDIISLNAITLTNVIVDNGEGANIQNDTASNKPVTITSSRFDNNSNTGLTVTSTGAITISNISASGNFTGSSYGASLDNHTGAAAPITLSGTNTFDLNSGSGLYAYTKGKITSGSMNANFNGQVGATFDNFTAATALPSTLTGTSSFNGNGATGLYVYSQGAITVTNLTAGNNSFVGAYLKNNYSFPSAVKVTGTNNFNSNGHIGLSIDSFGAISINNITSNGNGSAGTFDGVYAENNGASAAQSISLTGVSTFNQNTGNGAELLATGKVSLGKVTAFGNTGTGLTIENDYLGSSMPQSVTMPGPNVLTFNHADNLDVTTYGAVTISNLTASNSFTGYGAYVGKGAAKPSSVTLNGVNAFNYNSNGLKIDTNGTVLINGLTATYNTNKGVEINNTYSPISSPVTLKGLSTINYNANLGGLIIYTNGTVITNGLNAIGNNFGNGAYIDNTSSTTSASVTLNGINTFNNDFAGGLEIRSNGIVLTNNLTANFTAGGVDINNSTSSASSAVTLKGMNTFNNNETNGLYIVSKGMVIANNLSAMTNDFGGVYIDNRTSPTSAPVTLNGVTKLQENNLSGLSILSDGAVITNGFNATFNSSGGVGINNSTSSGSAPVTLNGINTFNNNGSTGLTITSKGKVLTNGLTASHNNGNGAVIDNSSSTSASPVTLMGLSTYNFNSQGLIIASKGIVLINGLNASNNAAWGVRIDNHLSATSVSVTLNGINTINNNGVTGLTIISNGTVIANNLNANSNIGNGADINNTASSTSSPVTLNGLNTFNFNNLIGLSIKSDGNVLINGATGSSNNLGDGVFIDNTTSAASSSVTLKGVNTYNNNGGNGLDIFSHGSVLLNGTTASNNVGNGSNIFNNFSTAFSPVTLNGTNTFNLNGGYGLNLASKGVITINNLTANENAGSGAYLRNDYLGASGGINLKGKNNFLDTTAGGGLYLYSNGAVTLTNISANLNFNTGLTVNTLGSVTITCGKFISNGTSHSSGYGWETGSNVLSIKLIGVTTSGNYSGDSHKDNGGTVVTTVPKSCSLP